jgi:hypothetical protein
MTLLSVEVCARLPGIEPSRTSPAARAMTERETAGTEDDPGVLITQSSGQGRLLDASIVGKAINVTMKPLGGRRHV